MRGGLLVLLLVTSAALAQPAPDLERARELYSSAEAAMGAARYDDAIRDYGAAYEISKDPALFYKIGVAHEKAKKCEVALVYYRRYLKEGKPSAAFVDLTNQRITACGGATEAPAAPAPTAPTPAPAAPAPPAGEQKPPPVVTPNASHRNSWLLVGGALTFVTIGAVLAYSANASEADLEDLYVGLDGQPPVFDARTEQRYQDLLDEGHRYEKLSWASFAVAGALAIGAAVTWKLEGNRTVQVTPQGTGAAVHVRF
jgi:hypothetical protein